MISFPFSNFILWNQKWITSLGKLPAMVLACLGLWCGFPEMSNSRKVHLQRPPRRCSPFPLSPPRPRLSWQYPADAAEAVDYQESQLRWITCIETGDFVCKHTVETDEAQISTQLMSLPKDPGGGVILLPTKSLSTALHPLCPKTRQELNSCQASKMRTAAVAYLSCDWWCTKIRAYFIDTLARNKLRI